MTKKIKEKIKEKIQKILDNINELMKEKEVNPYFEAELATKLPPKVLLIMWIRFIWTLFFIYAAYCAFTLLFFLLKYYYLVVLEIPQPLEPFTCWPWVYNLVYEVLISYMNWYAQIISGDKSLKLDEIWLVWFIIYLILGYFLYRPARRKLKAFVEDVLGEEFSDDLYW